MGIRMMPEQFPEQRRQDPKRRAEAEVFDALQQMEITGHGLYELRYRRNGRQVDYALWLHNLARFAVQVKGGPLRNGQYRQVDLAHTPRPSQRDEVPSGGDGGRVHGDAGGHP